jgi:uncharacterized protein YjbJ (UPF0337 family)
MADDFKGKAKHVGGKIEEAAGELLGDRKMKRHGKLSQVEGEAEQDQADAEEKAVDAASRKNAARVAKELDK